MRAVITGASRGIGASLAAKLAENGCDLFLVARSEANLIKVQKSILKDHPDIQCMFHVADLSEAAQADEAGQVILKNQGPPDILINNAGHFIPGSLHDEAAGTMEAMMASNFYSAYHLTRALLPAMMEGKRGHIINMCSIASIQAYPNGGAYSVAKFALLGFSKNLREEMKPHGIKVTSILPGATYTDSWASSGLPESRFMQADDIAKVVWQCVQLSDSAAVEEVILRPQLGDI